ncbi:Biofilm associated protein A, partial [Enterobacteriaceae bacterium YMB-R22]|uniref:Ig-like domain-containing protein n=1 Tax=Tenebrionicola larvae TaxID=2815733 RepID=UPI00201338AD
MNGKSIILVTRTMDGRSESFKPGKRSAKKIAVKPGSLYLLKNAADNYAPENITLKRVGKDLQVFNEGDEKPCLILTNYFTNAEGSERAPVLLGMAEDGQLYQYIPLSGEGYETGYLMDDGQMTPIALGGQPMGAGDVFFTAQESDNELWPVLLGLFALAGAVGAGIAIARHNRDKDDTRDSKDTTAPVSKGIGGALDNTGSKTGPLASGDTTDETRPQLTGKSEPGSTIAIYDNGKKIGETVSDDYGNWSWTPDKPLGEGKHELTTTETDKSGNTSKPSPGFEINVDTTAPESTTPPTVVDNAGDKTGPLKNGDATDDTQPELSGKGEPGNVIDIWDNGDKIGSTIVDKDGNWTWKPEKPLPEGEHELSTTETDAAGNTSEPSPGITIEVDTTVPATPSVPGAIDNVGDKTGPLKDGDITDDTQPELSGKGEPGNVIDIWDNGDKIGSTVVDEEGNWSWMPEEPLPEGEHELSTTETDAAGNTSEPSPGITIEVDTTPPTGSTTPPTVKDDVGDVTGELASGDTTDDTQPELTGKGDPGNVIDIWDNGDKIGSTVVDEEGNWSWMPEEPLPEGEHELSTTETDAAGNTSEPSPGITIEVDTTPPTGSTTPPTVKDDVGDVTGELASGDTTDDTQPELSGKGDPGNVIDIWDNGDKIGSTVVDEEGNWSWMPEEPLPEGEHELSTTETDAAGNTSEPSPGITIEVDTTPPTGSTTPPTVKDDVGDVTGELASGDTTDDTQPELSGKGDPGNVIDIWDNGDKIGSTVVDEEGNWSWMPEEPLPEGEHELSTTETDAAGNESARTPPVTITVDTSEVMVSITAVKDNVGSVTTDIAENGVTDDARPELQGAGKAGSI